MTDKQIKDGIDVSQCECYSVEDNSCNDTLSGSCMKEKCQTFRLLQTIKAKEQECEEWRKVANITRLKRINSTISRKNLKLKFDQLKAENEELKKIINEAKNSKLDLKSFLVGEAVQNDYEQQLDQLKQTLAEIKPILELYANSKVGEEQPDRTYQIMLSGGYIMAYDPRPAREGLKKISEVEDV